MLVVKKSARSKEEALEKGLEEINATESEVYYCFEEEEGGLFKGKKYTASIILKYDVKEYIKRFLNELAYKMNTKFDIEVKENDYGFSVIIVSSNSSILIGKEGRTLYSIQTILRQSLKTLGNFDIKVNLDISNYKAKREKNISREVRKIASEVRNTKIDAKLDPMNSYERMIVHTIISEYDDLYSESEGVTPNRYVVIKYEETKK